MFQITGSVVSSAMQLFKNAFNSRGASMKHANAFSAGTGSARCAEHTSFSIAVASAGALSTSCLPYCANTAATSAAGNCLM